MLMLVSRPDSKGYTFLEAVLVLAIASLTLATVAPNLSKALESFSVTSELREISLQINLFPKKSFLLGRPITLSKREMELPDGWEVETDRSIEYSQKGFCNGGWLVLKKDGSEIRRAELKAPFCELSLYEE